MQESREALVTVRNLRKFFERKSGVRSLFSREGGKIIKAVDDANFDIYPGEILGLIGESGSGKTTIGRLLMGLEKPDDGSRIEVDGLAVDGLTHRSKDRKAYYRKVQMVFQDPFESINPRFTVEGTIMELVKVLDLAPRSERKALVTRVLNDCGLRPAENYLKKYPHELSGGERQRLSIARALVVNPALLVADEPVSMLDVSIKAGVLNLLKDMARRLNLSLLYISHDLSTVKYLCDRMIIFYLGKMMELGPADALIDDPLHPYAKALKAAIPIPDPAVKRPQIMTEELREKSGLDLPGCRYQIDCAEVMGICREVEPEFREIKAGRFCACHLYA